MTSSGHTSLGKRGKRLKGQKSVKAAGKVRGSIGSPILDVTQRGGMR